MENSFIENINYVSGLDNRYGSSVSLHKNNLSLMNVVHVFKTTLTYYNSSDRKLHNIELLNDNVSIETIDDYLDALESTINQSIGGSVFSCVATSNVVDIVVNNIVEIDIEITSSNDNIKTYELKVEIKTNDIVAYNLYGTINDSLKILPRIGMLTDENINDFNVVSSNLSVIESVSNNIVDIQNAEENAATATQKALEASNSATEASESEVMARKWSSEPEDVIVSGSFGVDDEYSAYHWAKKAEALAGGSITLDSLYDVDTSGVVNGNVIRYNSNTGIWEDSDFRGLNTIGFDLSADYSVGTGELAWNYDEGTLDLGLYNGSVLQIGQENTRTVTNDTDITITNGTIVMFAGISGNSGKIKVEPFAGTKGTEKYIYGVATQDITPGSNGTITIDGKVRGINTTGSTVGELWSNGDILYAKPNDGGRLTNVEPGADEIKVIIASVISAHSNGTLEVRVLPIDENATAVKAKKLESARTISLSGDVSGSVSFDGSNNVNITTVGKNVGAAGTYRSVTTDSKGRVTAGTNPTTVSGYGLTDVYTKTEVNKSLALKVNNSEKGVANGVATLDVNGKVVLTQIPDSVLGQLEYMGTWNFATLPTVTQKGQYWIASVSGNGYIVGDWAVWNGSSFDKVDNTDAVATVAGRTGNVVLTKSDVGLANVDNTSDSAKPVSTAQQTALNLKANLASPTFTGTVSGITKSMVGLGSADNTADSAKNVLSSTKLTTARTIGGVSFDGTANINLPGVNAAGNQSTTGNAATATKLQTARNIALSGDVTGNVNFDGTGNVNIATTIAPNSILLGTDTTGNYAAGNTAGTGITVSGTAGEGWSPTISLTNVGVAGTYRSVTTDAQGRVTGGTNPTTISGYGIIDAQTASRVSAVVTTTANTWYRIATSAGGIGRNSAEFVVDWTASGVHGSTRFAAGCHYGESSGISLMQTNYSKYGPPGISEARIVYHTTHASNYAYVEVKFAGAIPSVTLNVEMQDSLGWTLISPSTLGSIPAGYTSYIHTFIPSAIITAGRYPKVTINQEGRVISGTSLVATDIPVLDTSKITTGTLPVLRGGTGTTTSTGTGNVVLSISPALTGVPTAPTAGTGTNTTQIATAAFVFNNIPVYAETPSYGLEWNETADTYTRVGDSDYTRIQRTFRRCVINADAEVVYYLHPNNSLLKEDGTLADLSGADGNVMVEVPLTYVKYTYSTGNVKHKWEIQNKEESGFAPHECFVIAGEVKRYRYFPAYNGTVQNNKLMSISGTYATTNKSRTQLRPLAKANGATFCQQDWLLTEFISLMALIEFGTMNIQTALGQGRSALTGGTWVGGSLIGINGLSNSLGNQSGNYTYAGSADAVEADLSFMSYRGIENFYGNVWKWLDGINVSERVPFVSQNPNEFTDDKYTGSYVSTGITIAVSSGSYGRTLGNSSKGFFVTSVSGGTSSVGTTDGLWTNTGSRAVIFGGYAAAGLLDGAFCVRALNAASTVDVSFGGGVSAWSKD